MKVVIIGCGGFGVKRLGELYKQIESLGNVELIAIDGSASDIAISGLPPEMVNLIEGKDGAGKVRAANAEDYVNWINANMRIVPEADLYINTYSVTGGTGSVTGPALTYNLTAANKNVINVCAITGRSYVDAKNAVNTINGLGSYVSALGKPVFVSLIDQANLPPSTVDMATTANIAEFSRIAAFPLAGLDSSDVRSFFNYPVHGVEAQLTEITHFNDADKDHAKLLELYSGRTLTQLSITNSQDGFIPELLALFDCHGIDTGANGEDNTHYLTSTKSMVALAKQVEDRLATFAEANKALAGAAVFGKGGGGMVY